MIRRLLDRAVRDDVDDVAVGLAAIDESFGILADAEWPTRPASDRDDHLARMWSIGS